MDRHGLVPMVNGKERWSNAPAPIYALRILRNGFNHDWTIGQVHKDVEWEGIVFRRNVGKAMPKGWQQDDSLLARLPDDSGGAEVVVSLIGDVRDALKNLQFQA
jgi:hypothetical protein